MFSFDKRIQIENNSCILMFNGRNRFKMSSLKFMGYCKILGNVKGFCNASFIISYKPFLIFDGRFLKAAQY